MESLSKDWLVEKHIDFEYKKYILLAYLQKVEEYFTGMKLYPHLRDIIQHYRNLITLRENSDNLSANFPQKIKKFNMEEFYVAYKKVIDDDALMQELKSIIGFAIPQFEHYLEEGKKIYDFVEEHIHIYPVGIVPLYPNEGYMLLRDSSKADTRVYRYQISIFEKDDDLYKGIHTAYVISYPKKLSYSMETIKGELVKGEKELPNPATYGVECDMTLPLNETFLPVAKNALVKHITQTT